MASPTLLKKEQCILPTTLPTPTSERIQKNDLPITKTTLKNFKNASQLGDQDNVVVSENQQSLLHERQEMPKPVLQRCLIMTNEEFYQWRQVLGAFHTKISNDIDSDSNGP